MEQCSANPMGKDAATEKRNWFGARINPVLIQWNVCARLVGFWLIVTTIPYMQKQRAATGLAQVAIQCSPNRTCVHAQWASCRLLHWRPVDIRLGAWSGPSWTCLWGNDESLLGIMESINIKIRTALFKFKFTLSLLMFTNSH